MAAAARKLQMVTTRFELNGKLTIVGILREFNRRKGAGLLEAPRLVKEASEYYGLVSLRLISYGALDYLLTTIGNMGEVRGVFPCPSGDVLAYEKPGAALGSQIVFVPEAGPRVIIPTWGYEGTPDIAIVVPNLAAGEVRSMKGGAEILIDVASSRLVAVPDFPPRDGLYVPHQGTGIPSGKEAGYSPETRGLRRLASPYVGLPVRCDHFYFNYWRYVYADCGPLECCGVAVEISEEDAARIEDPRRLRILREGGRIVLEGTPEQLEAAARAVEQWRLLSASR